MFKMKFIGEPYQGHTTEPKEVINKDLWYSTGNSSQYFVTTYMRKEYKKKSGYLYMYN